MTYEDYADLDAVRFSRLKRMAKSPLHYRDEQDSDTTNRVWLRLVHAMVLEPGWVKDEVRVWEGPGTRATKAYKEWAKQNAGYTLVKASEYDSAAAVAESIRRHPVAAHLLDGADTEVTREWTHPGTGLQCKGRLDILRRDALVVADLKTYGTSDERQIVRRITSGYAHAQLAHYIEGAALTTGTDPAHWRGVIISAENSPPYDVAVVEIDADFLRIGARLRDEWLERLAWCLEHDEWPGRAPGLITVEPPGWMLDAEDERELFANLEPLEAA